MNGHASTRPDLHGLEDDLDFARHGIVGDGELPGDDAKFWLVICKKTKLREHMSDPAHCINQRQDK